MEHIIIELCEVNRRNGKTWIDIIAARPSGYDFTECNIVAEYYDGSNWVEKSYTYQLTDDYEVYLNIPISDYVQSDKAMYKITLHASNIEYEDISETAYISDVEFMYHCMLNDLLQGCDKNCDPVSDDLIKKYLMLYGHQLASRYNETYELSSYLYKKMLKCGGLCKTNVNNSNSCGCKS